MTLRHNGPTALILTRQNVRTIKEVPVDVRRNGVLKGAYVLKKETGPLKLIFIASGSEVGLAWEAAAKLGDGVRVVSMPSMSIFDRQPQAYKDEVLPLSCRKRVSVKAGVGSPFFKYVGLDGKIVSVERFGFSAPGDIVFRELGMTVDKVVEAAKSIM
jgi:transketolase